MNNTLKPDKRKWRKSLKKFQRKKRRQVAAQKRDKMEEEERNARELLPEYQQQLQIQAKIEELENVIALYKQKIEEEAWLRQEDIAQEQFRLETQKRQEAKVSEELMGLRQAKELAALEDIKRSRQAERKKLIEAAAVEFEETMQCLQKFLDTKEKSPPQELRRIIETRPGQKLCEFYERTNSCRYGNSCTFNHRRPMLSRILVIRHFFAHPLLQKEAHDEYESADAALEFTERDIRNAYDEFFIDALAELEKFGKIINFRAVRNTVQHLRGHVFVEYTEERSALSAFINLQGRYYASKRLNVEFSNLNCWRGAVCGLSLTRKCPRGLSCAYLHLFKNPNDKLNVPLESTTKSTRNISKLKDCQAMPNWNEDYYDPNLNSPSRDWRWSASPELEEKPSVTKEKKNASKTVKEENIKINDIEKLKDKNIREKERLRDMKLKSGSHSNRRESSVHLKNKCKSREA